MDLCLESDTIDIHDWVDLPPADYDNLLPVLRAFMSHIHIRCHVGNSGASVIEARVRHLAHQNNAYDCGIFTSDAAGELLSLEELLSTGCSLPLFTRFLLGTEFARGFSLLLELIPGTGHRRVSV